MNKIPKVLGTLTLATLLAAASVGPVHAEDASSEVSSTAQSAVVADEVSLTFDSVAVTTVPAPVIGETIEETAVEPEPVIEEAQPAPSTPAPEVIEPAPEVVQTPSSEPTPDPISTPVPVATQEPEQPAIEEDPEPVLSIEELEARTFIQEGETYVGSFAADEDTWTAQGHRVVVSETIFRVIGSPLSSERQSIYHVYSSVK